MVVDIAGNIELKDFALIPHAPDALAQGILQENDRAGFSSGAAGCAPTAKTTENSTSTIERMGITRALAVSPTCTSFQASTGLPDAKGVRTER